MKCKQCGKEFEGKRSTAKYCSAKCRKLAFQGVSVPALSVPALSVPDGQEETDTLIAEMMDDTYVLPPLPTDPVLACNQDITWADVLAMSREDIDYVYKAWRVIGDNLLLRLKRAAGYHRRTRAA